MASKRNIKPQTEYINLANSTQEKAPSFWEEMVFNYEIYYVLESKNYILASHLPDLGRNSFISWRNLSDCVGNFMFSLEIENNLNNRNLTDLCYFRKVTEILIKLHDSFPEIILVYGGYLSWYMHWYLLPSLSEMMHLEY